MEIVTLEIDNIIEIHQYAIKEFGGENGYFANTIHSIESILNQQYPYYDFEKYPTIFDKSAMLVYFFVKDHCFQDGNKRVALGVLDLFLYLNGYELELSNEKSEAFIYKIAKSNYRGQKVDNAISNISYYIKNNSIELID